MGLEGQVSHAHGVDLKSYIEANAMATVTMEVRNATQTLTSAAYGEGCVVTSTGQVS